MKKGVYVLVAGILIMVAAGLGYVFRNRLNKKPAGLDIKTSPQSQVFLNDKEVGQTPYLDQSLSPGSYTIKLVPQGDGTLQPWETKLELAATVTTVVNHAFAASDSDSSGSVLRLVKEPGDKTYISIISDPDSVNINIDGKPSGFTPLTKIEITPGSHMLSLTSPGYKQQDMSVNTMSGYNLVVSIKLAADAIALATPAPTPTPAATDSAALASLAPSPVATAAASNIAKPYVVVQETGTGWLRVRQEPSASSDELGKANTGEKLKYMGESTETGWHKVQFEGSAGWVSGKYVELVK